MAVLWAADCLAVSPRRKSMHRFPFKMHPSQRKNPSCGIYVRLQDSVAFSYCVAELIIERPGPSALPCLL